jgi:hypothetical protein
MIQGWGSGKFGLDQHLALEAGTYELRAAVAAFGAQPGLYGNTFSFLLMIDGGRTIGDVPLLPRAGGGMAWRDFAGSFSVAKDANATLYWRAWGAGFFFVDSVSLRRRDCAPPVADAFAVGARDLKPLNFTPPLVFEDLLLCGYCDLGDPTRHYDPTFNRSRVCERCRAADFAALLPPPPAKAPRVIDDFAPGHAPLFLPDARCWNYSASGKGIDVAPGCWLGTDPKVLPADWSAFAYLRFRVRHNLSEPQMFYVRPAREPNPQSPGPPADQEIDTSHLAAGRN